MQQSFSCRTTARHSLSAAYSAKTSPYLHIRTPSAAQHVVSCGGRNVPQSTSHPISGTSRARPRNSGNSEEPQLKLHEETLELIQFGRRPVLLLGAAAVLQACAGSSAPASLAAIASFQNPSEGLEGSCLLPLQGYLQPGPWSTETTSLQLESTLIDGTRALIPIFISRPVLSNGGLMPQLPLVVFSPGFLTDASAYASYCTFLASWGFVTVIYNSPETSAFEPLADEAAASIITSIVASFTPESDSDEDSSDDNEEAAAAAAGGGGGDGDTDREPAPAEASSAASGINLRVDVMLPERSGRPLVAPLFGAAAAATEGLSEELRVGEVGAVSSPVAAAGPGGGENAGGIVGAGGAGGQGGGDGPGVSVGAAGAGNVDTAAAAGAGAGAAGEVSGKHSPAAGAADADATEVTALQGPGEAAVAAARSAAEAAAASSGVVLVGHSRGAKLSLLAAAAMMEEDSDSSSDEEEEEEGNVAVQEVPGATEDIELAGAAAAADADKEMGSSSGMVTEAATAAAALLRQPSVAVAEGPLADGLGGVAAGKGAHSLSTVGTLQGTASLYSVVSDQPDDSAAAAGTGMGAPVGAQEVLAGEVDAGVESNMRGNGAGSSGSSSSSTSYSVSSATQADDDGDDEEEDDSSDNEEGLALVALALIDPVDLTYDAPPGSLSCLPALPELLQGPAPPAVLIVGAGVNSDCIPRPSNYNAFFKACSDAKLAMLNFDRDNPPVVAAGKGGGEAGEEAEPDVLLVVVKEAGHLQFLDTQTTLQRSACRQGKLNEQSLNLFTKGLLTWWISSHTPLLPTKGTDDTAGSSAEITAESAATDMASSGSSPASQDADAPSASRGWGSSSTRGSTASCKGDIRSQEVKAAADMTNLKLGAIQEL